MALDLNKIRIACGPTQLNAPDNLKVEIIQFIDDSKTSLEIAVQEIDNPDIAYSGQSCHPNRFIVYQ